MISTDESFEPGSDNIIIAYGLLQKYFEIEFDVLERRGPGYFECAIKSGRNATTGRADIRFKVNSDDVIATNFRVSKHTIDVSMFTIPTSIKVILDQFETQNRSLSDYFAVGVFADNHDPLIMDIHKTGRTLFISDLGDEDSFVPMNDDFIDPREILAHEFPRYIAKMKEKGYLSILIMPILYVTDSEQSVPFGFISMYTKEKALSFEDILEMKDKTFKLVDRVRDANTAFIEAKQQIVDISRSGIRLKIDNMQIKQSLLKARGFVFDIVFRLQAPITVFGEIKFTATDPEGNLLVGICFTGSSSRKNEMKRFYEIMQPMEIEYKRKLMARMKTQG